MTYTYTIQLDATRAYGSAYIQAMRLTVEAVSDIAAMDQANTQALEDGWIVTRIEVLP